MSFKIKSQRRGGGGGVSMFLSSIELGGLKNLSYLGLVKRGSLMISLPVGGWPLLLHERKKIQK